MRKVLIVTNAFPPKAGGGVQRMVSFANVLKDNDYQVVVLAPASKYTWLDEHRFKSLKNLEIIRLPVPLINNHLLAKLVSVLVPLDAYIFWCSYINSS